MLNICITLTKVSINYSVDPIMHLYVISSPIIMQWNSHDQKL